MPIEILMPALSPTMTEGNLAKWLKHEGDEVHSGDVLAEIETDKATMEVEAVDDGRVGKILVPEGTQGVKVNQPIALLLGEGEDETALSAMLAAAPRPAPVSAAPEGPAAAGPTVATAAPPRPAITPAMAGSGGFSPARWRAAWRSRPGSIWRRSPAPARRGGSSRPTSKRRSGRPDSRQRPHPPHQRPGPPPPASPPPRRHCRRPPRY